MPSLRLMSLARIARPGVLCIPGPFRARASCVSLDPCAPDPLSEPCSQQVIKSRGERHGMRSTDQPSAPRTTAQAFRCQGDRAWGMLRAVFARCEYIRRYQLRQATVVTAKWTRREWIESKELTSRPLLGHAVIFDICNALHCECSRHRRFPSSVRLQRPITQRVSSGSAVHSGDVMFI